MDHRLKQKKQQSLIKFSQEGWLKSYKDMGMKFRTKAKIDFEKDFLDLVNTSVFGKTMQNIRKKEALNL